MYSYALITNHHHMIGNWLLKLLHFWSWNPHCFLFAEHRTTKTDFVLRRCGCSFLWPVSEPEERSKINRIQPSTIGISWDLIWFNSSNSIVNGWISRKSRGNMRKRWFLPQQSPAYYIGLQFRFFFFQPILGNDQRGEHPAPRDSSLCGHVYPGAVIICRCIANSKFTVDNWQLII